MVVAQLVVAQLAKWSLRFESRHRQIFYLTLFNVNCIEKRKIKKKRTGMAIFLKNVVLSSDTTTFVVMFRYIITTWPSLDSDVYS